MPCLCRFSLWLLHIRSLNESLRLSVAGCFAFWVIPAQVSNWFRIVGTDNAILWRVRELCTASAFPNCFISFTELHMVGSATASSRSRAHVHLTKSCLVSSWWTFLAQGSAGYLLLFRKSRLWLWLTSHYLCHLLSACRPPSCQ